MAARLGAPHLELDSVYHQANWQPLPPESLRGMVSRDPEKSIMRWAWRHHATYAARYADLAARSDRDGRTVVRLRSRREVDSFLANPHLTSGPNGSPGR